MKKIIFIVLILSGANLSSQNINDLVQGNNSKQITVRLNEMTDGQLLEYWNRAKTDGYSLSQLKIIARSRGASEADILEFDKRIKEIENKSQNTNQETTLEDELSSIFGISENSPKSDKNIRIDENISLPIFGMDFFVSSAQNLINAPNNSPQLNIATPSSYQLGPGDELTINIWGASEITYNTTINTSGYIKIDRVSPVYISGQTISSAKTRIRNALAKVYAGLYASDESFEKVFFDLNLTKSRSIVINITGAIKNPGTYTLSSMTSVLNALYAAGGPNELGSFRNIKIIRNGKTHTKVDLYNYFVKGISPNLSLRDQDVILIPRYENRVFVNGEFKELGIFEIKQGETVSDLLDFTGGFSSFGYKEKVFITSISNINKEIFTVSKDKFGLKELLDGDIIKASPVSDKFLNKVSIEGAVFLPGEYSIEENPNITSLISSAQGLKDNALSSRAIIYRYNEGKEQQMISINLSSVISGEQNFIFQPNDRVQVFSKTEIEDFLSVEIKGEVNDVGVYDFYKGMTVSDLILLAGGVKSSGSFVSIDIFRQTFDKTLEFPFESIDAQLKSDYSSEALTQNPTLMQGDLVVVRLKEGYTKPEYVEIDGLVKSPGYYSILNNKYSLYDLLNDSGGILPDGAKNGVKIRRVNIAKTQIDETIAEFSKDSLNYVVNEQEDFIEFGVDINQLYKTKGKDIRYNVILKDGDRIIVPKIDNTIEVIGEVGRPTVIAYKKGLSVNDAIGQAGGLNDLAKRRGVFVVYQNGNVSSTKKYFIFRRMPKLEPGSKVVVPKKIANPNKTSIAEIIGLTSTLATLAVLIKSL
ncbi:MAG: SLBB domain-containing protein [Flavobacteriaceae bacterium]